MRNIIVCTMEQLRVGETNNVVCDGVIAGGGDT